MCGENKGVIVFIGGNATMNTVLEMQCLIVEHCHVLAMQLFWWAVVMSILGLA